MNPENTNIAETIAREMKEPVILLQDDQKAVALLALPPGWQHHKIDNESVMQTPRRKKAMVKMTDADSFTDYIVRHGSLANCTIWCDADFTIGNLSFLAIINDHGEEESQPAWRDHRAGLAPEKSEEWKRWFGHHGKPFDQAQFAAFLEENLKDISAADGMPAGGDILKMAINFESKESMRFKSAIRLQSGGVRMEYVADEEKSTIEAMEVFERFQIAIPVFRDDTARYPVVARLRYRARDGKVGFWYELIRPDLVMETAARAMVKTIRDKAGMPFFFGNPFFTELK